MYDLIRNILEIDSQYIVRSRADKYFQIFQENEKRAIFRKK